MNQSIVMKKQELRNRYLQRRNDLSVQQRKEYSGITESANASGISKGGGCADLPELPE